MKTVGRQEADALAALLPRYVLHFAENPRSVLGRYLALFSLDLGFGLGQRYVTVMHSVFDTPMTIGAMYDLKGSTKGRDAKPEESYRIDVFASPAQGDLFLANSRESFGRLAGTVVLTRFGTEPGDRIQGRLDSELFRFLPKEGGK